MSSNINNINYSDFKNICRVCMFNCDVKFHQDDVISNIFYKLTDIHFEINDDLPQQICLKCYEKINEFHEFSLQSKRAQFILTNCLIDFKQIQLNAEVPETNNIKEEIKVEEPELEIVKNEYVRDETSEINNGQNINCFEDSEINKSEEKQFVCDVCNKIFINVESFNRHKKMLTCEHHRVKCSYTCEQCSKLFKDVNQLKQHMLVHSGERPYKCEQCPKTFLDATALKRHVLKHSGDSPFKCDQCGISFTLSFSLMRHMLTHSGERRSYKCNQCPQSCRDVYSLREHMRTHSGERPYNCEECSKSFKHLSSLKQHMSTHGGERPYKCSHCSKSFHRSDRLARHVNSNHSDVNY